ncbi:MAG: molybdenum cofactor cytidylyltransferase [Bermanella sp.]|jgi:molybdenum cofactor cytidylyltransferase|uniref:nucleotidyltransferase family protein n=1 Tax=Glaciecola sp. 33A TaxID=2057807 RepID=UPI000C31EACD|nr:nucleotidyltransferase family protein [Glaciecola sp. 33A]PKI03627.1 nucleotidyltransferase family protein [Glaciecola sp. 33A]
MNTEDKHYCIEAILLAAGESRRFNDTKQLAFVDKKPMLVGTVEMLKNAKFNSITVVLGANASNVKNVLQQVSLESALGSNRFPSVNAIIAHKWQQGMGASIAAGIENLAQDITHVFIGLTDQVEIRSEQCNLMMIASRKNPNKIVAAFYNGKLGAPAIFPKAYFAELALLENDKGARNILRANAAHIISIDMPEAARDIDTKKDLLSYQSNTQT